MLLLKVIPRATGSMGLKKVEAAVYRQKNKPSP
jgi:hypothetical protein